MNLQSGSPLELWGGVECTVNRVGDRYFDQLLRNGHAGRLSDLDRFAELGIRAIRYPVLWERTTPNGIDKADWSWPDERLLRLRELGIRPIVGLVHHGSGPRSTSLIDPAFGDRLAEFAGAVAERYPWIEAYTPVNEPLTTARFSGLYGLWYPHGHDVLTLGRALLTQLKGVVLAMQAIRAVNPHAQLVQTEDLGKTFSTPGLAYQAFKENERRWLTFDLLCGRVDPEHAMWGYFHRAGVAEDDLQWFRDNPCPPDLIGINHYLTSERLLDERLELYPAHYRGGNTRHQYADIEAVRVLGEGPAGPYALLYEAWQRYQLPLAITEVHNGSTREEQMRWLVEMWQTAEALKRDGVDIRAVTVWSLLGSYDWNSLVTQSDGFYESGVFDVRAPTPRPTALAPLMQELAAGQVPDHPVLAVPGWWHQPDRFMLGFAIGQDGNLQQTQPVAAGMVGDTAAQRPILITGATGTLGQAFARICDSRHLPYCLLSRAELDIAHPPSVRNVIDRLQPWAIVNAAGYVRVDDAEHDRENCYRENSHGPAILAAACAERGIPLLTFSSDLVFDGLHKRPYLEHDLVNPLNVYGCSKAEAEACVLTVLPSALVVRTSAFFGPWDEYNFVTTVLRNLAAGQPVQAANDVVVSPTYIPDLIHACLDLLIDGASGIWHLANRGAYTWADLARCVAKEVGLTVRTLEACSSAELGFVARRPAYTVLESARGWLLPEIDDAIRRYLSECESPGSGDWRNGYAKRVQQESLGTDAPLREASDADDLADSSR